MTIRTTFRIAEFNLSENDLPSPEELAEAIDDDEFTLRAEEEDASTGEELEYWEKGRNVHFESDRGSHNFCYFTYVTDTQESFRVRNEDNEEVEQSETILESSFVVYFDTGEFVFQTRQDIPEAWIPVFIANATGVDVDNNLFTRRFFDQDDMNDVYNTSDEVSKIAFSQAGDDGTTERSSLSTDMRNLAEICEGLTFSTGNTDGNLRGNSVIDAGADSLEIKQVNTKNGDENTIVVKDSGRLTISWNENNWSDGEVVRNRAQTIRSKVLPYL